MTPGHIPCKKVAVGEILGAIFPQKKWLSESQYNPLPSLNRVDFESFCDYDQNNSKKMCIKMFLFSTTLNAFPFM